MILPVALFTQLAVTCAPGVAPGTLAAVAAAESRLDPLAVYDNATHSAWRPRDRGKAVALAQQLIGAGHSVDLGLMQINSGNLSRLHLAVSGAFDPCVSLRAGARLLVEDYERAPWTFSPRTRSVGKAGGGETHSAQQTAIRVALSRYNTGSPKAGFRNGYVARVVAAAKRVVPEIDPDAIAAESSKPAATPSGTSRAVFDGSQNSAQPSAPSSWNVFPQSVGPDRLAEPPPTAVKGSLSPAGMSIGGTHD